MNVYNLICPKLDKRYFLSEFIKSLNPVTVVYKEKLTLKQLKLLSDNNIELIHIDDGIHWKSRDVIILYGNYLDKDIFKFNSMCGNLIIISISLIPKNTISKHLDVSNDNILSLQNDGSNYIHKTRESWKSLTKEQIISIISREIRLRKILKKVK